MSRGKKRIVRDYNPDIKYGSSLITRFVNIVMQDGKKVVAQKIVFSALGSIEQKILEKYSCVADGFESIVKAVGPTVMTKTKRIGGSNYQIPMPVEEYKRIALGMRLLLEAASARKGISMNVALSRELEEVLKEQVKEGSGNSEALKKKINIEKMAAANKAYAHLA